MTPPKFNSRRAARHRILRQLGHGNLTRVFLATPVRPGSSGKLVVLKLMHPELARDEAFRALFLDQAASSLSLRHPNLVRTLEVVADPGSCGVTMEFLQGQTLARVLERVGRLRFPVDLHLHILSQVLAALDHAHRFAGPRHAEPGFLHRDVCPSNVFITYDGQVKLLGTGFGSAVQGLEARLGRPLLELKYAAPEVLLGHPSGPSADLFSAGVMVWEALARQARIESEDPKTVVQRRTSGEELDLERAWPDASVPLIALCARALASSPRDRYPTALGFRADLDAHLGRYAETSDAVLARLPELMEASFGPEREQMELFIGACLGADEDAETALAQGADDELTPRESAWTAKTSAATPTPEREEQPDAGFRTGLRRARPEPALRRETGVHERGLHDEGRPSEPRPPRAQPRPVAVEPTLQASLRFAQHEIEPPPDAPAHGVPLPPGKRALAQPDPTTAGHQAYSSNLEASLRPRRSVLRTSPDVLGAVALLLGSLVAVYSFYRHAQGDRRPESQKLAILAEARESPPPASASPGLSQALAPMRPAAAALVSAVSGADAGTAAAEPVAGPAFFDGRASAPLGTLPALRADELPAVDPALRSLQDAIVSAAKAHRSAVERRRARKAESASRSSPAAPAAPRELDAADPSAEGSEP